MRHDEDDFLGVAESLRVLHSTILASAEEDEQVLLQEETHQLSLRRQFQPLAGLDPAGIFLSIQGAALRYHARWQQRLEERTQLANELHDSLAQTLASLKFQIRVLDDTLRQDSESAVWQEMERIESSIDEANVELRELIVHFRAPLSRHGLIPGIRRLLSRLRQETGTETVLQNQADDAELSSEEEAQVLRIAQEALANVRKHSRANMVRVLLSCDSIHRLRLIIEDDGVGMVMHLDQRETEGHFGLAIMHERAGSIGAELMIESEPGDGTRIVMKLDPVQPPTARVTTGDSSR